MSYSVSPAENFSRQWSLLVDSSNDTLKRNDRLRVSRMTSYEDVEKLLAEAESHSLPGFTVLELEELSIALEKLKGFFDLVFSQALPATNSSIFWGLVGLVVELSQSEEGVAPRVPRMLHNAFQDIDLLNKCLDKLAKSSPESIDSCFYIVTSLVTLLVAVIKFIREDMDSHQTESQAWESIGMKFINFKSEVSKTVSQLEMLCTSSDFGDITHLTSTLAALPTLSEKRSSVETATLPCFIYPSSRTSRFFDRTEDIIEMDRYFGNGAQDLNQPLRSIALYGIGGVGKSSVALRYAETRIHRKELDALFWVAGEKEATLRQSFSDIAGRLKLPGAQAKDYDQNRSLVLDWFQVTACRWLLIFDNVESADHLMTYWPTASRGQAIITMRNHNLAFFPADRGLEITPWGAEEGSQFLVHLLSTDISKHLNEKQATGTRELSLRLSGHAIALSLMAGLINRRSWSIDKFVEIYAQQPLRLDRMFESSSVNALWEMSFLSLSEKARAILGVMAFLSPDFIPQALFELNESNALPDSLKFCEDPFDFSDEMQNLMMLSLVKRNKEQRAFSIHRLVQTSFKHFISLDDRQECFNDATMLVSAVFPRKNAEFSQMYHQWDTCVLYLPHVLSLRDSFREEKRTTPGFSALMSYCDLNNACQRYLIECNGYNDLLELVKVNAMALPTIPPQPWTVQLDLEGSLASHWGQALERVGKAADGVPHLEEAYRLFSSSRARNLREAAWSAENLADGYASINNFSHALKLQQKARDHWLNWAKENSGEETVWPAILKWGMGNNLIWAGQSQPSRDILHQGLAQLEATEPYNWAMVAYTNYALGTVSRSDGDFNLAERHFTQAHNKWISGNNLLSDPFCGACVYRMGCTALDQGNVETAVKHLREACKITERHKVRMPVEHARSLFKLSEALQRNSREATESMRLREESQRLLLSRLPQVGEPDEKTFDDLIFIWWR